MKRLLTIVITALVLLYAPIVTAQLPRLQVYFDPWFTTMAVDCPDTTPYTQIQELYIVAHSFNDWISAIEFRVLYPTQMMWMGDHVDIYDQLSLGSTPDGIAVSWPIPANGFEPILVVRSTIMWTCQGCDGGGNVVCFDVYPSSGKLRAVTWPNEEIVYGFGQAGVICQDFYTVFCPDYTIPVEPTTWGSIKAMYRN
jgi:hypothetical protein